jgi:hypothetical protein
MSASDNKTPDLGCATATPLELRLLAASKAFAKGNTAEKAIARADYVALLAEYLRQSGQMTDANILRPLIDLSDD